MTNDPSAHSLASARRAARAPIRADDAGAAPAPHPRPRVADRRARARRPRRADRRRRRQADRARGDDRRAVRRDARRALARRSATATWHDVAFERSSAGGWFASLPAARAARRRVLHPRQRRRGRRGRALRVGERAARRARRSDAVRSARDARSRAPRAIARTRSRSTSSATTSATATTSTDRFVRAELVVHAPPAARAPPDRVRLRLDQGRTPLDVGRRWRRRPWHALRYGFGEVRVRVAPVGVPRRPRRPRRQPRRLRRRRPRRDHVRQAVALVRHGRRRVPRRPRPDAAGCACSGTPRRRC